MLCAQDLNKYFFKYLFNICSRLTEQYSNKYIEITWNSDRKSMARQEGGQVCWSQHLFWLIKEILQKDLSILSPWKPK